MNNLISVFPNNFLFLEYFYLVISTLKTWVYYQLNFYLETVGIQNLELLLIIHLKVSTL